jgi:hypothetical protein
MANNNGCGCNGSISSPSTGSVIEPTCQECATCENGQEVTQVLVAQAPVASSCCNTQTSCNSTPACPTTNGTVVVAVGSGAKVGSGVVVPVSKQGCGTSVAYFKHSLKILNSFSIPLLNTNINVAIEPTKGIAPGAILFHSIVGWLRITAYYAHNNTIDIQNFLAPSVSETSPTVTLNEVGRVVDACTEFSLGTPDYSASAVDSGQLCLETSFFSPVVDVTGATVVTVEVSSVTGVVVGSRLSIGGYEYVVATVVSATVLEIYNTGAGAPAGTKVTGGRDCNGGCLSIVTILSADNPCSKTAVEEGILLVCDGQDIKPFVATAVDSIPVWDGTKWVPQVLNTDTAQCTTLTADCTIDDVGADFIAVVTDTSIFATSGENSLLILDGGLFRVTSIINATQMRIDPVVTPVGVIVYPAGLPLCVAGCCACPQFSENVGQTNGALLNAPIDVSAVGVYNCGTGDMVFENPSQCRSSTMFGYIRSGGALRLATSGIWIVRLIVDGVNVFQQNFDTTTAGTAAWMNDFQFLVPLQRTLAPGEILNVSVGLQIETTAAAAPASSFIYNSSPAAPTAVYEGLYAGRAL